MKDLIKDAEASLEELKAEIIRLREENAEMDDLIIRLKAELYDYMTM